MLLAMNQENTASPLVARVVHQGHVRDATFLYALAKQEYQRLRDTCLPELPEFDARNPVDGSAAVELCLSVRTGAQAQHVDRGLFNLVTGELDAIKGLHLPPNGPVADQRLDQAGATVLMPGMTCALLLSDGDMLMPPLHSADIPPGQQLIVIAVKLRVDLPVRALCWTSLQQALAACFAQGSSTKLTACSIQAPPPALKRVSELQEPAGSSHGRSVAPKTCSTSSPSRSSNDTWHLTMITGTGDSHHINHLNGMSTIQELYVAAKKLDGTPINQLQLFHKKHHLNRRKDAGSTLQDAGVCNDDKIQMHDKRYGHKWQLLIRNLDGKTGVYEAEPTTTVGDLKAALSAKTGISVEQMRLICGKGQLVDDDHTLLAYGIRRESTVEIMLRLRGD